jgi:hypothetical protein
VRTVIFPLRPVLSRLVIPVIGLALVAIFTILYVNHTYIYNKTISAIIVYPPYSHPFIDWEWIPSSIECWHRGVNVYLSIPCYAPSFNGINETFDYSPLWLRLSFIRFAYGWTNLFGLSFALLFLLSLTFLPLRRTSTFDFVIMLFSAISSATVFLLERANGDIIMFLMIIVGVSACSSRLLLVRLAGYTLITLAGLLKFYPMVALIITIRERLLIFAMIALAVIAALAVFVSTYYEELVLVVGGLVSGAAIFNPLNWGAKQLPGGLGFIISKVAAKLFHQDAVSADTIGQLLYRILLLLLVVQALATAIWLGHRSRLQYAVAHLSMREADFLLAGAALICGCFFTCDNALYRGIYLLFALPGLLTLAHRLPLQLARAAFRGTCFAIVFVVWSPFLRKGARVAVKALGKPVDYQWSSWSSPDPGDQGLDRTVGLMVWLCDQLAWWWIVSVLLAVLGALVLNSELLAAVLGSKALGGVRHAALPSQSRWTRAVDRIRAAIVVNDG